MIKLLPNQKQPIAHEFVFPETLERTLANCTRYVLRTFLYATDIIISDLTEISGVSYNSLSRCVTLSSNGTKELNLDIIKRICTHLNINLDFVLKAGQKFYETDHNCVIASNDFKTLKFFYAYECSFETDQEYEKSIQEMKYFDVNNRPKYINPHIKLIAA